jgi:hypothetical protein
MISGAMIPLAKLREEKYNTALNIPKIAKLAIAFNGRFSILQSPF